MKETIQIVVYSFHHNVDKVIFYILTMLLYQRDKMTYKVEYSEKKAE